VAQFATRSYVLTAANRYLYSRAIGRTVPPATQKRSDGGGSGAASTDSGKFPRTLEEEITARLLVELGRDISSRQGGGKLLIVFTEDLTSSQEMAEYLIPFEMSCLDLEGYIDAKDTFLHLPDDFHWNSEGHKRVAEILAEHLRKYLK
jgi:hypothetical protein